MNLKYCKINDAEFDPRKVENTEKHRGALHEAGNCVVAKNYSLNPSSIIYRVGDATSETRAFAGRMVYDPKTRLRRAVLGWGGLVAEHHFNCQLSDDDIDSQPDGSVYEDRMTMAYVLSATDQKKLGEQSYREFAIAWKLVFANKSRIEPITKKLARGPVKPYSEGMLDLAIMRTRTKKNMMGAH